MEHHVKHARFIANLLDRQFKIGGISFGLDPIIGAVPVVGDIISIGLSLYIFYIGKQMNISRMDRAKMISNIMIDFITGLVPFLGDIFDIAYKANVRNLRILEKYTEKKFIEGELLA